MKAIRDDKSSFVLVTADDRGEITDTVTMVDGRMAKTGEKNFPSKVRTSAANSTN